MSGTIEQRVAGIERRIAKVERHLGLAREERAYAHVAAVETVAVREAREVRAPVEVRAPIAPPPLPVVTRDLRVGETIEPARVPMEIPRVATAPLGMTPRAAATQTLGYERAEPPQPPAGEQTPWEQLIGLKLAGWVGAVVLVIGAGLGIKFAYDRGVFQGVPPGVWLSLLSLFAFALDD